MAYMLYCYAVNVAFVAFMLFVDTENVPDHQLEHQEKDVAENLNQVR